MSNEIEQASMRSRPWCFSDVRGACVLETRTHNLLANLGELIRYACTRADSLPALARALGISVPEVRQRARVTGVRLPPAWQRRRR